MRIAVKKPTQIAIHSKPAPRARRRALPPLRPIRSEADHESATRTAFSLSEAAESRPLTQ
jgi:hypothetical protein